MLKISDLEVSISGQLMIFDICIERLTQFKA